MAPDTYATTLLAMYVDVFGADGLQWDPATIVLEIEDHWDVALPRLTHDRLMVAINLISSDDFYKNLPSFVDFCNVLNGDFFDPTVWDKADAAEVAWGITESLLINPPDDDDEDPFTEEIRGYIGAVLDDEGIITPPDILRLAMRGEDPMPRIQADFSDDPEMFGAIVQVEAEKTADINRAIITNLKELAQQLEALELTNGSTKNIVQMFQQLSK